MININSETSRTGCGGLVKKGITLNWQRRIISVKPTVLVDFIRNKGI